MTELRRRRGGHGAAVVPPTPEQRPFAQPQLRTRPAEVLSVDEIESIHRASLKILATTGMDVLDPETRAYFTRAGCTITEQRVRFDPEMIESVITTAPAEFTMHSWNPERNLQIGGNWQAYGTVASAPNVCDLDHGRRAGNRTDYQRLLKLAHMLNSVHFIAGYPVEPTDIHASVRHLHAAFDHLTLTDKVGHVYSLGRQRNLDVIEMARIARGVSHEEIQAKPSLFTVVNTNSPLRLDVPMGHGIIEMATHGQVTCVTPFTLSGAMAPVTLAGALALQNAEALVGLTLTQLVRPGAPFVYGGFTSNVDMQSGAPAFGTPEYVRAAIAGGQLARRYNVPYRSSNACAANAVDAQAAYESVFALWGAVTGGVNMLMHGAGWMEGGLHASYEKMVLDADLLHMVSAMLDPVVINDDTLALEAIDEVGPGGHFFGVAHTRERFRSAFYRPMVSDWRNWGSWVEAGKPEAVTRANKLVKDFLGAYEQPAMNDARRDELAEFVERRVAEGGVKVDY